MPQVKHTPPRNRIDTLRSTARGIEKTTRGQSGSRSMSGHVGGSRPREEWVVNSTSYQAKQRGQLGQAKD